MDTGALNRSAVLVLDQIGDFIAGIRSQLEPFGICIIPVALDEDLNQTAERHNASHLLVRVHPHENGTILKKVAAMTAHDGAPIPLFISENVSMAARVAAVRAGAGGYLAMPVDALELVDRIDKSAPDLERDPYRVMVVDDDPTLSRFFDAVLTAAGMKTEIVNDPMEVLQRLPDFRPELILLDHYMPDILGRELAAVIRQEQANDSIPIVFLSAEDDVATQQKVMQIGGDDFLTKPIRPDHLIGAVTTRARRFRALRAMIRRDSLTGLLNHTATTERVTIELSRMNRTKGPLSFAIIDLDNFKSVNDTYGHPTGDRVIKTLAHLLRQRLRMTDIIGRFGGEEFAIALPETAPLDACRVLDEIREGFAQLLHSGDGAEFTVTFSCGVASYPEFGDLTTLTDAADKALYKAKRAGRNRVESL